MEYSFEFTWLKNAIDINCVNVPLFPTLKDIESNQKRKAFFESLVNVQNETVWSLPENSYSEEIGNALIMSAASLQEIVFRNHCFSAFSSLEFSLFHQLKSLRIGDYAFCGKKAGSFILHNVDSLQLLSIGKGCFTSTCSFDITSRIDSLMLRSKIKESDD